MNNFGFVKRKTPAQIQEAVPTFPLTKDGNYDFRKRRICNLTDPQDLNDATNKLYVDNLIGLKSIPKTNEGSYDFGKLKLRYVAEPEESYDATSKGYVDTSIISKFNF